MGIKRGKKISGSILFIILASLVFVIVIKNFIPYITSRAIISKQEVTSAQLGFIYYPHFDIPYTTLRIGQIEQYTLKITDIPPYLNRGEVWYTWYNPVSKIVEKVVLYSFDGGEQDYYFPKGINIILPHEILKSNFFNKDGSLRFYLYPGNRIKTTSLIYTQIKNGVKFIEVSPSPSLSPSASIIPKSAGTPMQRLSAESDSLPAQKSPQLLSDPEPKPTPKCNCKSIELITQDNTNPDNLKKEYNEFYRDGLGTRVNPAWQNLRLGYSDIIKPEIFINPETKKPDVRDAKTGGQTSTIFIIKAICEVTDNKDSNNDGIADALARCYEGQEVKSTVYEVDSEGNMAMDCKASQAGQSVPIINPLNPINSEQFCADNPDSKCYDPEVDMNSDEEDDTKVDPCRRESSAASPDFGDDDYHEKEKGLKMKKRIGYTNQYEIKWIDTPTLYASSGSTATRYDYFHAFVIGDDCSLTNPKCNICFTIKYNTNPEESSGSAVIDEVECKYN